LLRATLAAAATSRGALPIIGRLSALGLSVALILERAVLKADQ